MSPSIKEKLAQYYLNFRKSNHLYLFNKGMPKKTEKELLNFLNEQLNIEDDLVYMENDGNWADYFGWTETDLDDDGFYDDPELGEWGYIDWILFQTDEDLNGDGFNDIDTLGYTIFHPYEVLHFNQ